MPALFREEVEGTEEPDVRREEARRSIVRRFALHRMLTSAAEVADWYGQRNWSREGVVRTMTRIDVPARGATLPAGRHRVAGVAYAGDRGVRTVEYSADGGETWREAELLEPAGRA